MIPYMSHGIGRLELKSRTTLVHRYLHQKGRWESPDFTYPTVTSKMLLPTELDTAISPKPLRATITDVIRSGIEVPAAKNVSPITCKWSGVLIVSKRYRRKTRWCRDQEWAHLPRPVFSRYRRRRWPTTPSDTSRRLSTRSNR
uniref:Uncharacterized protein n=1 Tax=Anopheles culicifacies TaxID=139723 RepID=A0A182M085_9DIPT